MTLHTIQKTIKKLLDEDQRDRGLGSVLRKYPDKERLAIINTRDHRRITALERMFETEPKLRGIDYFRAGFMYKHGNTIPLLTRAKQLGEKAALCGYLPGKWLSAASTDNILIIQGKRQKFGTQFGRDATGKWQLLPFETRTTGAERKKYNVMPLQKIRKLLNTLNKKPIRSSFWNRFGLSRQK